MKMGNKCLTAEISKLYHIGIEMSFPFTSKSPCLCLSLPVFLFLSDSYFTNGDGKAYIKPV